jgi:hypothetical protein
VAVYFSEAVLKAVEDRFIAALPAQLAQAETDAGLSAGDLPVPESYVRDFVPQDNRSLVQVYSETGLSPAGDAGQLNRIYHAAVMVVFSFRTDADTEAGAVMASRVLKAMVKVVELSVTLGDASGIVQAALVDAGEAYAENESASRRHVALELDVMWAY